MITLTMVYLSICLSGIPFHIRSLFLILSIAVW